MKGTKIEWCTHTFNPWWGCQRVSPGCEHCYAEAFAKRTGHPVWGPSAERRLFGDKHWSEPTKWNASAASRGVRERVFCASMADVFEDRRDLDAQRERLWALIATTPALDWLLLTKRPQNIAAMLPAHLDRHNVWLGTTTEDQQRADERLPHLIKNAAAVHFASYEPALGPVDFTRAPALLDALRDCCAEHDDRTRRHAARCMSRRGLDWVIVGGESGPGARPFDVAWARSTIAQCRAAGVACFVKQLSRKPLGTTVTLKNSKGGDMSEWIGDLSDLAVREYPEVQR